MIRIDPTGSPADLINDLLTITGMRNVDLAQAAGVPACQISRWRAGDVMPSGTALLRMLAGFGYDLALVPREDA